MNEQAMNNAHELRIMRFACCFESVDIESSQHQIEVG